MNLKQPLAIMGLSLLPTLGLATQHHLLSESTRLQVAISCHELNRIGIQGDRIHQVFGADQSFSLETDEQGGQLFIKPLNPQSRQAINISLVTESGLTQDLRLTPEDIDAVSLILKTAAAQSPSHGLAAQQRGTNHVDDLIQLVQETMQHKLSSAYSPVPCPVRPATSVFHYQPQGCWQGPHYQLYRYQLTNVSSTSQGVEAAALANTQDTAIAVGRPQLAPQQATTIVIIGSAAP